MLWLATLSALVAHCACAELSATAPQPEITAAPSLNATIPVGAAPVTIAVNTTFWPTALGLIDDVRLVIEEPTAGMMLLEAADAGPVPAAFEAVTVNVYAMPLLRPVTTIEAHAPAHVPVRSSGEDVAVEVVIALPPLSAGGMKVTCAWVFP